MDDAYEETIHLECAPLAVRSARNFVASTLRSRGWSERDVERAQVVVSELVANAVVHARTESTMHIRIDGALRLEVVDAAPDVHLQPREPDLRRVGGMGLRLVADISRAWGVERSAAAKAVWCEVEPTVPLNRPVSPGPDVTRRSLSGPDGSRSDLSYS